MRNIETIERIVRLEDSVDAKIEALTRTIDNLIQESKNANAEFPVPDNTLYTSKEVADMALIDYRTFNYEIIQHKIPTTMRGSRVMIRRADALAYLNR